MNNRRISRHKYDGKLEDRYQVYRDCCDDGNGKDKYTGEPLKTFDEWLGSDYGFN